MNNIKFHLTRPTCADLRKRVTREDTAGNEYPNIRIFYLRNAAATRVIHIYIHILYTGK